MVVGCGNVYILLTVRQSDDAESQRLAAMIQ